MSKSSLSHLSRLAAFVSGLALALLVACTATPVRTQSPRVSISDIEPLDLNLFEQRHGLTDRDVEDITGEHAVFLAEHHLEGRSSERGRVLVSTALEFLAGAYRNEMLLSLADLALEALEADDSPARCDVLLRRQVLRVSTQPRQSRCPGNGSSIVRSPCKVSD